MTNRYIPPHIHKLALAVAASITRQGSIDHWREMVLCWVAEHRQPVDLIPLSPGLSQFEIYALLAAVHDFDSPEDRPEGRLDPYYCTDIQFAEEAGELVFKTAEEARKWAKNAQKGSAYHVLEGNVERLSTDEADWLHDALLKIEEEIASKAMTDVSVTVAYPETSQEVSIKRPAERAFIAWRLRDLLGINSQAELAKKMTENGVPATQGQVSRWLKQVEKYLKAGGVLPELSNIKNVYYIDPSVIDMGPRQDKQTPRPSDLRDES